MPNSVHSSPEQIAAMTDRAREVVRLNIEALEALERSIDVAIARACDIILSRPGYLVVTGMGKSGHIGGKIAATLASTGTNSFFVHPAEMSHGDLGMLRPDTTLLAISNSGESRELRDPLIYCQRNDIPVIGITQRAEQLPGPSLRRLPDHAQGGRGLPQRPGADHLDPDDPGHGRRPGHGADGPARLHAGRLRPASPRRRPGHEPAERPRMDGRQRRVAGQRAAGRQLQRP